MENDTLSSEQDAILWSKKKVTMLCLRLIGYGVPMFLSAIVSEKSKNDFLSWRWIDLAQYNSISPEERRMLNEKHGRPRE